MMKERKLDVAVVGLVIVFILSGLSLFAEAQPPLTQKEMQAQIQGISNHNGIYHPFVAIGTEFTLPNNPIFPNLKIISTEEIQISIDAITNTVSFSVVPLATSSATATTITIQGLEPFWQGKSEPIPLYLHQDGQFQEMFSVDTQGKHTFSHSLDNSHHIYIWPRKGTIHIYGWPGQVINLSRYGPIIYDSIVVESDGIIIDGTGTEHSGWNGGTGIYLYRRSSVTIRNCNIHNWGYAIHSLESWGTNILDNSIHDNWNFGIRLDNGSWRNNIVHNTIWNSAIHGISIAPNCQENTIERNTIHHSTYGAIMLGVYCYNNWVISNTLTSNYFGISNEFDAYDNKAYGNTIKDNTVGVYLQPWWESPYTWLIGPRPPTNMLIWHNNIYSNSMYNFVAWDNSARELSRFAYDGIQEGNYWGHNAAPGFYISGVNTPPDSNYPTIKDTYFYLVENGWQGPYGPNEPYDNTDPKITALTIDGWPTSPAYTKNPTPTVYLTADDNNPAYPYQYSPFWVRFGNTYNELINSTDWKAYTNPPNLFTYDNWPLSIGDGEKTIYAQVRNRVGRESAILNAKITIDTTGPTISQLTPSLNSTVSSVGPTAPISASYADNVGGSGIDETRIQMTIKKFDGMFWNDVTDPNYITRSATKVTYTKVLNPPTYSGDYKVKVVVYDRINISPAITEWEFSINSPPNTPTLSYPPTDAWITTPTPPILNVQTSDPDRDLMMVTFQIEDTATQGGVFTMTGVANVIGGSAGWQPATLPDGVYRWHAYARQDVKPFFTSSWSGWWTLKKDTKAPTAAVTVSPSTAGASNGVPVSPNVLSIKIVFSETMNTAYPPTVTYDPVGVIGLQPCTTGGTWSQTTVPNDTYTVKNTNEINAATGDGIAQVSITGCQDLAGNPFAGGTSTFVINIKPFKIENVFPVPAVFNPQSGETATISYVLSQPAASLTFKLLNSVSGITVRTFATSQPKNEGLNYEVWNGKYDPPNQNYVPNAKYNIQITASSYADEAATPTGSPTVTVDSTLPVINDLSIPTLPDIFSPGTLQIGFSTSILMGVKVWVEHTNAIGTITTITDKDFLNTSGNSVIWDGTNASGFVGSGTQMPDGVYSYGIRQIPIENATRKTGTIMLVRNNTAQKFSTDGKAGVYYNPASGSIDIQQVDPATLGPQFNAIVTADPSVYIMSSIYEVTASGNFTLNPALLVFTYDSAIAGGIGNTLRLRRWDTSLPTPAWVDVVPQYVDLVNKRIIAEVKSFSFFVLMASPDTVKPSITGATPTGNITSRQPVISAAYSDTLSGIKLSSVKMTLNGSQVAATVSANNVSYNPTLAPGNYNVVVTVQDNADNTQTANWSFTIVNQSPSAPPLPALSPPYNSWVTFNPTFSTTVSDPDLDNLQVYFEVGSYNSGWLTAVASGSPVTWSLVPDLPDGIYSWRVQAKDSYGLTGPWSASRTIYKDTVKPSITGATPTGNITSRQPVISAAYSDTLSGIKLSSVKMTLNGSQVAATVSANNVNYNPTLAPGNYNVVVTVQDNADNIQTANWSFTIVNQSPSVPTLNSPANNIWVTSNPTFSATVSDPDLDTVQAYFEVGSYNSGWLSVTSGSPVTWSRVPDLPDGTYSWRVQAKDSYGLTGPWSASRTINKDTALPSISNLTPPNNSTTTNRQQTLSASYSDALSGINISTAKIYLKKSTDATYADVTTQASVGGSGVSYSVNLMPAIYNVQVTVSDNAGNPATVIWSFTVVNQSPSAPTLNSPANNSWVTSNPTFSATVSDPDLDTVQAYFEVGSYNSGWLTAVTSGSPVTWYRIPDLPDGTYTWRVQARDTYGATTWSASRTINKDSVKPSINLATATPSTPTNERRPAISVQYSDTGSGIDTAGVQMTVDGGSVTPQTINASDVSYTPSADLAYGEHTIVVTVKDNAGNITNAIDGTWKFIVNKPPNPPALQSPDNNIWVNYDPTLTVQVSDDDVGDSMQVYFEIDGMNSGWIPATPVSNNSMVSWPTVLSDGTYTWKAKARDNHDLEGNWSIEIRTINKDTSPPTASNITFLPGNIAGSGNGIAVPPGGFTIQIVFNETMNTAYPPTITYDPVGVIGTQPCGSGTWSTTTYTNDTYTVKNSNEINAATGDGTASVAISGGQDLAGNPFAGGTSTFVININPFKIENVVPAPAVFNPQYETSTISYVLSEPAQTLTFTITDLSDTVVRTLVDNQPRNAGINYEIWDGAPAPDGQYKIQISATSYASEPAAQSGTPTLTLNSVLAVFNDTSSVPYPFVPPAPSVTVGFNNLNSPNPPIDIVMSITDMAGAAITNSGIEYYGLGVGASGSKTWDGTDALNFGTGGNPCADGLYYYEITQVGAPPLANPKIGTILLLRDNNAETLSGPVTVYYNNSAGRSVNVQSVDPATLGPQYNAIVTADPSVYIMSSIYEVTASGDFTLNPALLVFTYNAAITGDVTNTLRLRRWDTGLTAWVDVPNQRIDLAGKRIIAQVTSFTLFALFTGADTTPPIITVTSPAEGQEYYNLTDGQSTIIPITYIAEDPVIDEVTSGVTYTSVTLNGQVYTGNTIDLSNLLGENTLTVTAIDGSGNFAGKTVRFTVVLPAVVTVKPESLHINGGVMTVFVQFPAGYDVAAITDAFCDGARYESMTLEPDGARMAIKFRRANLAEPVDAVFEIRGAFQFNQRGCIFKGTGGNKKVLDGSVPPETTTNTTPDTTITPAERERSPDDFGAVETSSSSSGSSGSSGGNNNPPPAQPDNNKGGKKK